MNSNLSLGFDSSVGSRIPRNSNIFNEGASDYDKESIYSVLLSTT